MADVGTIIPDRYNYGAYIAETQVKRLPVLTPEERDAKALRVIQSCNTAADAEHIADLLGIGGAA